MRRYRALLVSVLATALIGAVGGCTNSKADPAAASGGAAALAMTSADDLISSIEARALWARFGL